MQKETKIGHRCLLIIIKGNGRGCIRLRKLGYNLTKIQGFGVFVAMSAITAVETRLYMGLLFPPDAVEISSRGKWNFLPKKIKLPREEILFSLEDKYEIPDGESMNKRFNGGC